MRRARNRGVVYSGEVGAKMRAPSAKPKLGKAKQAGRLECHSGPLKGKVIQYENHTGPANTLAFTLHGQTGRYFEGRWQPQ